MHANTAGRRHKMLHTEKRIVIFAGHYGSGKTNLAVNYALELKKHHERVILCDVDTVNPYFRTKDSEKILEEHGITLISPEYANSNVDLPSLPALVNTIFADESARVVIDVGGDDAGAIALGQYADRLKAAGYEMLLVINAYRYLTRSPEDVREIMDEIELAARLKFTGIVNNSNLGKETTTETIAKSLAFAQGVHELTDLPVLATSHRRDVAAGAIDTPDWEIDIYTKEAWKIF